MLKSFGLHAQFSGDTLDQVQTDCSQCTKVFRGMTGSRTALILMKNNIKTPVQCVLYLPMPTDATRHFRFVARQAADVVSAADFSASGMFTDSLDEVETAQAIPRLPVFQP
jgi:hypothetical protein